MNSLGLKIFCFIAFYSWAHHQNGSAFWSSDSNAKIKIENFEMRIISFCQIFGLISARSIENKFIRNDQAKLLEFMVTKDILSRIGFTRTTILTGQWPAVTRKRWVWVKFISWIRQSESNEKLMLGYMFNPQYWDNPLQLLPYLYDSNHERIPLSSIYLLSTIISDGKFAYLV